MRPGKKTSGNPRPAPLHQRALTLAEAGQNSQALTRLQEHLLKCPRDGDALNDAGAILYALGRHDQAARHLRAAMREMPDWPHEVVWNLAEVYLAGGQSGRAVALLDELADAGRLTADLANHVAMRLIQDNDPARAVDAFLCSFRVETDQPMLAPLYHRARQMRPKIAFFYDFDDLSFAEDIYAFLRARFETRLCGLTDPEKIADLMDWCDIAWFEWCGNQIVTASRMPKTCRIICRLHGHEAYMAWPTHVRWQNVDVLVTVGNPSILAYLRQISDRLGRSTRLVDIPNAVDVAAWPLNESAGGKDLACLSRIHCVENFALLLQCFHRLRALDSEYHLHLADPGQRNGMLMQYTRAMVAELDLTDSVHFDGMPDSVSDWLRDKHYIVSCSVHEGHPTSILEGMACGLTPVIHTWPGVRDFFPPEFLFRTVEEFCDRVLTAQPRGRPCRTFVAERFALESQLDLIDDLFGGLERDLAQTTVPAGAASQ